MVAFPLTYHLIFCAQCHFLVSQPKKEGEFCGRCLHTDCPDSCPRGICGKCEEGLVCKEDFLVIPYRRSPVANPLGKCVNQTGYNIFK